MSKMILSKMNAFVRDEEGMELTEYAIVGGLIIVVGAAAMVVWGQEIKKIFDKVVACLQGTC